MTAEVSVSIVSHGHGYLVSRALSCLQHCPNVCEIIVIKNIPNDPIQIPASIVNKLQIIDNPAPLGFAANQNQANKKCKGEYFALLNPDVYWDEDPFPHLLGSFEEKKHSLVAPAVLYPNGKIADNFRPFITPLRLFKRLVFIEKWKLQSGCLRRPLRWIGLLECSSWQGVKNYLR